MDERLQIRAFQEPYDRTIAFYGKIGNQRVTALQLEPFVDGEMHSPSFRMWHTDAQELMDSLWSAGLRPAQGKQSEGVTAAQGRHLEDMRAIAFGKLNMQAPQ